MPIKRRREFRTTVAQLIAQLQKCEPDAPVVVSGTDHSYRQISGATEVDAELNGGELYEYYDDDNMFDATSKKVTAVYIE